MDDAHISSLLSQIEALTPHFGRARPDLEAICSRARNEDFRGVLQNARLVTETLLRAIMVKEKNQTPGKQMLDQLLGKLYQEGKPSVLPTHMVVHMRTIQAWGNVGAHDHASDLSDEGLEVSRQEALACLNSMLAILTWYREKYLDEGEAAPEKTEEKKAPTAPAPVAVAPTDPQPAKGKLAVMAVAGAVLIAGGVGVMYFSSGAPKDKTPPQENRRARLADAYRSAKEPLPPKKCETNDEGAMRLFTSVIQALQGGKPDGKRPEDTRALSQLEAEKHESSTEYWNLLARAKLFAGADRTSVREATEKALTLCDTYASPYNTQGTLYLLTNETQAAELAYRKAFEHAPDYIAPRYNLGLVFMKNNDNARAVATFSQVLERKPDHPSARFTRARVLMADGEFTEAIKDLLQVTKQQPNNGLAFLLLGQSYAKLGRGEEAQGAFCASHKLGTPQAEAFCKQ